MVAHNVCPMTTTSDSLPSAAAAVGVDVAAVLRQDPFDLAAPLAALSRDDLELMSGAGAEVVVAATQRLTNALAAIQTAAVTTFADRADEDLERYRRERREDFEERRSSAQAAGREFTERWHPIPGEGSFAAAALAPLLRVSPRTMATRVRRARRMDHEMPATWDAARAGDLEPYRADAVVRAGELLEVEDLTEYEARVYADDITDLSTGDVRKRAHRAAVATDRSAVEEVAERAIARRGVSCGPDRDVPGLTTWRLSLPAETSARLWAAVDELGREYHRACRAAGNTDTTLTQARADALADLVLGQATVETTLELVVPVAALAEDAAGATLTGSAGPAGAPASAGSTTSAGAAPTGAPHPASASARFPGPRLPRPLTPSCGRFAPAARRGPAEVLRGQGLHDELILAWVTGRDLHTASTLEAELALQLTRPLEIDGNPHLDRSRPHLVELADDYDEHPGPIVAETPRPAPPPQPPPSTAPTPAPPTPQPTPRSAPPPTAPTTSSGAWFVPGHSDARRVGALLPDDLARLITDPATRLRIMGSDPASGSVITDATVAYRPRAGLLKRVRRRDGTCRFPGCATPADRTQLDHVTPWPHGSTSVDNLVCLCTSHHGFKHHAGWRLSMTPDGVCTWTAPTGRTHTTRPHAVHSLSV